MFVCIISPGKVPDLEQIQIWHYVPDLEQYILQCIAYTFKSKVETKMFLPVPETLFFASFATDTYSQITDIIFHGKKKKKVKNQIDINWLRNLINSIVLMN